MHWRRIAFIEPRLLRQREVDLIAVAGDLDARPGGSIDSLRIASRTRDQLGTALNSHLVSVDHEERIVEGVDEDLGSPDGIAVRILLDEASGPHWFRHLEDQPLAALLAFGILG